jgi:hypothetical protein
MEDCEVIPQNWFNEDESNIKPEDNPVRDIETVDDNEEILDIDDETTFPLLADVHFLLRISFSQ